MSVRRVAIVVGVLVAGCSISSSSEESFVAEQASPIIGGAVDPGHAAVVALSLLQADNTGALCTGTIVRADPVTGIGYVLTAGHCIRGIQRITTIQSTDYLAPVRISYQMIDAVAHPDFDGETGSDFDVGMVRIFGVDGATPTVPILADDVAIGVGTRVTSVGYGRTERPTFFPTTTPPNTQRRRADGAVTKADGAHLLVDYDAGDICHGDSGGPVLAVVDGKEHVVGVHSFVEFGCFQGKSVRPALHAAFLATVLERPAPPPSCDTCRKTTLSGRNVCAVFATGCRLNTDCAALKACADACAADAACTSACKGRFPDVVNAWAGTANCACNLCASACAGDDACAHPVSTTD